MSLGRKAKVVFMEGRHTEALAAFFDAARDGDAEAAFDYAFSRQFGFGKDKDEREARSFYNYAKEHIPDALYNLAVMYMHGAGGERNYRLAYEYMRDAAAGGVIEAQLYLGIAHTMGTMLEPDIIAISHLPYHTPIVRDATLLIEGEVPDALADEEARMRAVRFDPHAAFEWFRIAARHDRTYVEALSVQSKYLYARCFVDGLGTDFDRKRAEDLMLVAADAGSPDALAFLEERAPYRLEELKNKEAISAIRTAAGLPE